MLFIKEPSLKQIISQIEISSVINYKLLKDFTGEAITESIAIKFIEFENENLNNQLILVDSALPEILAQALLISIQKQVFKFSEVLDYLIIINPLNYNQSLGHRFYEYKLKKFLSETVFNHVPNIIWSGLNFKADADYIEIKENGSIKYYMINRAVFEEYLLINTVFEPSDYGNNFGLLFYNGNEVNFKLSLRIKFN